MLKDEVELQKQTKAIALCSFHCFLSHHYLECMYVQLFLPLSLYLSLWLPFTLSLSLFLINTQMSRFSCFWIKQNTRLLSNSFCSPRHSCHMDRWDFWTKPIFDPVGDLSPSSIHCYQPIGVAITLIILSARCFLVIVCRVTFGKSSHCSFIIRTLQHK